MSSQTLFDMDVPQPETPAKKRKGSASWFPKTNGEMLMRGYEPSSGSNAKCRSCQAPIEFWKTPTGKTIPMNLMPTPETPAIAHWATCKHAAEFRKVTEKPCAQLRAATMESHGLSHRTPQVIQSNATKERTH